MDIKTLDLFNLENKIAIITGANGLLGKEHAIALSDMGCNLVLTDINIDNLIEFKNNLNKKNSRSNIDILKLDVTSKDSWIKIKKFCLDKYNKIDILVNNAAFTNQSKTPSFNSTFFNFPLDDFNKLIQVNLNGSFLGCQIIGEVMVNQKNGSIINMASLYGVVSPNHTIYENTEISQPPAYSISKAGVIQLTKYCGTLFAKDNVRVNCITPSGIFNNHSGLFLERFNKLIPMKRMADKSEMRGALVYLASNASSHCTGHNLIVDGGWTSW